ncbi:hypothetical protein DL93DRAFT_1115921 [Clavulina sp. PMI_390]|nr:hypothetical protein DL93DRAFT_1115921 [Clavulina sp. PMI_390]
MLEDLIRHLQRGQRTNRSKFIFKYPHSRGLDSSPTSHTLFSFPDFSTATALMTRYLALMIAAVFITLAGATMLPLALLWDPRSNLCLRADAAEAQRCTEWWEASIMMVVLAMACGAAAFALRMALPPAARNTQARNDLEGMSRNAWKGSAPPALLFVASPRPPAPLGMHMEASHMTQRATRNAGEQGSPASPTE